MPEGEATGGGDSGRHGHTGNYRPCTDAGSYAMGGIVSRYYGGPPAAPPLHSKRMATETPQFFYLLAEDLYRVGNSEKPRLENVRTQDIQTYERNGLMMVRANGRGISIGTEQ